MSISRTHAASHAFGASRSNSFRLFPLLGMLHARFSVASQRRTLAKLDDSRIADLGLSRKDIETEVNRSFWDVPAHWRG